MDTFLWARNQPRNPKRRLSYSVDEQNVRYTQDNLVINNPKIS